MTESKHPDDAAETDGPVEHELGAAYQTCVAEARRAWIELAPHVALEQTFKLANAANAYVDRAAPWSEAKNGNTTRVNKILSRLLRVLEALSVMIWPAMPNKSDEMRAQLGLQPVRPGIGVDIWPLEMPSIRAGLALAPSGPLFPTFDDAAQAKILDKLVPPKETEPAAAAAPAKAQGAKAEAPRTESSTIAYDDFAKVDLRVGLVKTCEKVPKKDKLLRLTVDLGEPEVRTIVAGLALSFSPEALVGKKVIVVANLAPREFGSAEFDGKKVKLVSHGMLLASGPSEDLRLATIDGDAPPGALLK
jgi:methionyl-tRNA synthetase